MAGKRRSGFGNTRKLPSGRWQARYTDPAGASVAAPCTFDAKRDAETWLSTVRADLARGSWLPPDRGTTLAAYSEIWLRDRPLRPRTRALYRRQLDRLILPELGDTAMRRLTPAVVRQWHAELDKATPTQNAQVYALLRTVCGTAVADELLAANPCRIRGAGNAKRTGKTEPASLPELARLVEAMPRRYKLMVLLAAWCALRYGELAELRRCDVDVKAGIIRVRRAVVVVDGKAIVGPPKSDAGVRDVNIPPHLMPAVREHLKDMGVTGRNALLFPAAGDPHRHLTHTTFSKVYSRARAEAGRPGLRFHDLRHTGAVLAAATGATLAELMARLGHSTPGAALRYQHAAKGRDAEIAKALSKLAEGN